MFLSSFTTAIFYTHLINCVSQWINVSTDWGLERVELWNLAGIFMQENDGSRPVYIQFWTFREDFNADE